jgi:hypothetical protein
MTSYKDHSARIAPAPQSLQPGMQEVIDGVLRGRTHSDEAILELLMLAGTYGP